MNRPTLRISIFALLLLVLGLTLTQASRASAQDNLPQHVFDLVNALRAEYGLAPYTPNAALAAAAQGHSDWGASVGYFDHVQDDGSRPKDRAVRAGYGEYNAVRVSENIYWGGNATAQSALNWWRNSSIHFAGMTSSQYQEMGVGVAYGPSGGYFTLVFGVKLANIPPASSSSGGSASSGQSAPSVPDEPDIPEIATQPARPDGSIIHVVGEGQAIWNIGAAYKVDVLTLLALNSLTDNDFIHIGDEIIVRPANTPTPPPTATRPPTLTPLAVAAHRTATLPASPDATGAQAVDTPPSPIRGLLMASLAVGIGMLVLGFMGLRRG